MRPRYLLSFILFMTLAGTARPAEVTAEQADALLTRLTFTASNGLAMPYRLFRPADLAPGERVPLLVFLHGRGDRGTDNRPSMFNRLPLFVGSDSILSAEMQMRHRCIVLVPQCSDKTINEEWAKWVGNTPQTPWNGLDQEQGGYVQSEQPSESGAAFLELVESMLASEPVDRQRVYLTGISMGGFGAWEFAMRRPNLWAALVPMAGYSDQSKVGSVTHIPTWIFHGGADRSNPVQGSRNMYRLLNAAGADVRYTEYPRTGHSPAFGKAWREPDLLPWLFAQQK